jgi:hypothetical protein
MRNLIYSITAFLTVALCTAQTSLTQAEYFWDTDPGIGLATPVLATDGNFNSAFEQLTKNGIAAPGVGLHKFCIRVKDNTGQWGPVFMNIINVEQPTTSSIMSIVQAEYFWDTDPGVGLGTPVLATDGNFDSAFEKLTKTGIALPSLGLHVFNIRVKDNTGQWGSIFRNVISVQTSLEIDELDMKALVVYPNPVKDVLNISFDTAITTVAIYNMIGQQVMARMLNSNEATLDVSALSPGTYFVQVHADTKAKTLKIIKE